MCNKIRYLSLILLFITALADGQGKYDFTTIDSLTYRYYLDGDWDQLIKTGNEVINNGTDYKYMRQRLGYAYFMKGDYNSARIYFEKALYFDSFDSFTLTWLYYSFLNCGDNEHAALIAGRMTEEKRNELKIRIFTPVESVDAEYTYKFASTGLRTNPYYFHVGIGSQLGKRISLYQMASAYRQDFLTQPAMLNVYAKNRQSEYYALLKLALSERVILKTGYHFLGAGFDGISSYGHLGIVELSVSKGQFYTAAHLSYLKSSKFGARQAGIEAAYTFPGRSSVYLKTALALLDRQTSSGYVFTQTAGGRLSKKMWIEVLLAQGDMTNFNDHSGLYVYNVIDPMKLRAGFNIYYFAGTHLSLWTGFAYERRDYYENTLYHYNQFSYTGGIKWKL